MAQTEEYRKVNCPSCGAPLPPSEEGPTKCPFCGTVLERTTAAAPGLTIVELRPTVQAARGASRGCIIFFVVMALFLATGGVILALVLSRGLGPEAGGIIPVSLRRSVNTMPIPLRTDRAGAEDLLLINYDIDSSLYLLTYLNGDTHTVRWDSQMLSAGVRDVAPVVSGTSVYLLDESRLLALNLADGTLRWQTTLSDKVLNTCRDCLQVVGDYVVVLTNDGRLHGLEAASGRPAWDVQLNEAPRALWLVNGKIAVMDKEAPGDYRSVYMQFRDPTTGRMAQHLQAVCARDHSDGVLPIYDPTVLLGPGGKEVYFFYAGMPGCAQRWDVESARLVWQTVPEKDYFSRLNREPILAGNALYGAFEGRLMAFDTAMGERRILVDDPNYELSPVGESGGVLIVLAERTRGSTRYELWGVAAVTGERKWQRFFEGESPLEEPGARAGNAWSWYLSPRGLMVLHMRDEPRRLVLETIDPQTGASSREVTSELGDDTWPWSEVAWSDNAVWVVTSGLYTVDLGSGALLWRWP